MPSHELSDADLVIAFDVLLGKAQVPHDQPGHAVYYASDTLDEELFPNTWVTPGALADQRPRELPWYEDDDAFSPSAWRFDLARSLFRFDSLLFDRFRPFEEAFVSDVRAASLFGPDEVVLRGVDLGPLLARHGVDLSGEGAGKLNCWLTVLLRVATDGTLGGGMRAATFTHAQAGPLVTFNDKYTGEQWEGPLGAVGDRELRDHLRMLCLDAHYARSDGAFYCGREWWPFTTQTLERAGCSLVAGWEFGESQAGTVVVELGESPLR
jgi:hypothetical protein